jgi:hypothetical protein
MEQGFKKYADRQFTKHILKYGALQRETGAGYKKQMRNFLDVLTERERAVAWLVQVLCYKQEGRGFDSG